MISWDVGDRLEKKVVHGKVGDHKSVKLVGSGPVRPEWEASHSGRPKIRCRVELEHERVVEQLALGAAMRRVVRVWAARECDDVEDCACASAALEVAAVASRHLGQERPTAGVLVDVVVLAELADVDDELAICRQGLYSYSRCLVSAKVRLGTSTHRSQGL